MIIFAINTAIVTTGIAVFLIVTLVLVGILLFAKAKLTAKGDIQVSINKGDRVITTEPGSSLLATLGAQKIFLPSACGGVLAVCASARWIREQALSCRRKRAFSLINNNTRIGAWLAR